MRVEHGEVRRKDVFDMLPQHNEGLPLALQFIAADAAEMAVLLAAAESQWERSLRVDINMGCPFPLQVRHGRGAGLLQRPEQVEEICRFVEQHPEHTFSVKMRLGVDEGCEWESVLPLLNAAPLCHVTLHPRVAAQQYGGAPDMDVFERFMSACRHPIIYNGDVTSVEGLLDLERRYPDLHGVMLGRGLLARPTLAREYVEGVTLPDAEVKAALRALHYAYHESFSRRIPGEAQRLAKLRTFWDYAEPLLGRKAWKKIHKAGSMRNYLSAIDEALRG